MSRKQRPKADEDEEWVDVIGTGSYMSFPSTGGKPKTNQIGFIRKPKPKMRQTRTVKGRSKSK